MTGIVTIPDMLFTDWIQLLRNRAETQPEHNTFTFLNMAAGTEQVLTNAELDLRARALAAELAPYAGQPVLLLFPPGMEYLAAFFGCLYAGVTAVPAYPPNPNRLHRSLPRLAGMVQDAGIQVVLTTRELAEARKRMNQPMPLFDSLEWRTVGADLSAADSWTRPKVDADTTAFLQYTSGSTSEPKGVVVSHGNLLHNQQLIQQGFQTGPQDRVVSWLPLYHDMGLIGAILQPLFLGAECYFMAPMDFLRRPFRWLETISRLGGTVSGAPNFAYDLCARKITDEEKEHLDLGCWQVAFNGAEPVRRNTLDAFNKAFAVCGFRPEAFYPCYGLAEATLFVSGGDRKTRPTLLSVDAADLEQGRVSDATDEQRSVDLTGNGAVFQRTLIVDPDKHTPLEDRQVGEIWVRSPSVAGGYFERPEQTEAVFQGSLASGEGPFLRTGDLGFLNKGELYITGRVKDLIIIRGRNLYPQDIELTVEKSSADLIPGGGAAFAVQDDSGERLVIVWETVRRPAGDLAETIDTIREAVVLAHEVQIADVVLIRSATVPKTSSGKIRRRECRKLYLEDGLSVVKRDAAEAADEPQPEVQQNVAPAGKPTDRTEAPLVTVLRERVSDVLMKPAEKVPTDKSLTILGLDSLNAVELQHLLEEELGRPVDDGALLDGPTIEELAAHLQVTSGEETVPVVSAGNPLGRHPLTHGQRALWFLSRLRPNSSAYHIARAVRLPEDVNLEALRLAFYFCSRRHPLLRATLGFHEGEPFQQVHSRVSLPLTMVDAMDWDRDTMQRRLEEQAGKPFGEGLQWRLVIYYHMDGPVLLLSMHHAIADFWSLSILVRELGIFYQVALEDREPAMQPLKLRYTDYVHWQDAVLAGAEGARLPAWWRQALPANPEALHLPTDKPRPKEQTENGAEVNLTVPGFLMSGVRRLALQKGATPFNLLLAAWQVLLHRYSDQDDIITGTPAMGRSRAAFADLFGYFVNPLPIHGYLGDNPSFSAFLEETRRKVVGAFAHQDYPFPLLVERLQPDRDPSYSPIFQVMFVYQSTPPGASQEIGGFALGENGVTLNLGDLKVTSIHLERRATQFDLTLNVAERADGSLALALEYNTDLFEHESAARMAGHYSMLLSGIMMDADAPVQAVPLLTSVEREQILSYWNRTGEQFQTHVLIHQLFERQAVATPEATAVMFQGDELSYAGLNQRANRLAYALMQHGVVEEAPVGICLSRGMHMITAILAVLKAGGAYIPLDPTHPAERKQFIAADAGAGVLLTDNTTVEDWRESGLDVMNVETEDLSGFPDENPVTPGNPLDAAYIIYTSGSTGKPKGVAIAHNALINTISGMVRRPGIRRDDRLLAVITLAFDMAAFEIYLPLLHGATLVVAPQETVMDGVLLGHAIADYGITIMQATPATWQMLFASGWAGNPNLRAVTGGEALSVDLAGKMLAACGEVWDQYGPTEAAIYATRCRVKVDVDLTIGRPIANVRAHVLDRLGNPSPIGVPGELWLGGAGLARGYFGRPDLTAAVFRPDPFGPHAGGRLYRTGDLVRYRTNGHIQYLGRQDHQVKIRGYRIELGEIEADLAEAPGVAEGVVTAHNYGVGGMRLIAYVVPAEDYREADVLESLRGRLPEYMVPSVFVVLPQLPLTPNGKVDRRALPVPSMGAAAQDEFTAPRTVLEEQLAAVWREVLELDQVSVNAGFFELGGHSLLAARVVSRIRRQFGVEMPLRLLFAKPTIKLLAVELETLRKEQTMPGLPAVTALEHPDPNLLSFAQERLWFLDRLTAQQGAADDPARIAYNMPGALRMRGRLDIGVLEWALSRVIERHAALRTRFPEHNGAPQQRVEAPSLYLQPVVDLTGLSFKDREQAAAASADAEAMTPFNLARGPLLRITLLKLTRKEWVLVLNMHHIVSDGWSVGVLIREFTGLYRAAVRLAEIPSEGLDREALLPELPVQYADYAAWQRDRMTDPGASARLHWWRNHLQGAPALLELPTDRPRPVMQSHAGGVLHFNLGPGLTHGIKKLAQDNDATLFMTLEAAFALLLLRYSGREDVLIGTPNANRNLREIEGLIGFFVNTLVLRHDLSAEMGFRELLANTRAVALDAFTHGDVPFERLVEAVNPERDLSHSPLFQVMFALQNIPAGRIDLPGLTVARQDPERQIAKFDLTLELEEGRQGLRGLFEYNTDLFDRETIARLADHYTGLLTSITVEPERNIRDLNLMSVDERIMLLYGFNETERPLAGADKFLHQDFLDRAAATPEAPAVRTASGETLTYAQVEQRTAGLAAHLQNLGVGPETVVGLCAVRSLEMVVGMLSVLRAGGAYLPLDPDNPVERLSFMVRDAGVSVILAHEPTRATAQALPPEPFYLETALPKAAPAPVALHAENPAYVIYTSGSTGNPKGVPNTHRGITNRLMWLQEEITLDASDRILQKTPYSFDVSVWEFFQSAVSGGLLVLARPGEHKDPMMLARTIADEGITTIHFVPSMLAVFLDAEPRALDTVRRVICSGEALSAPLVRDFYRQRAETGSQAALFNLYGPTEASVEVTWWHCPEDWRGSDVPIGKPIANLRTHILDQRGHAAPLGVPGELCLAGVGLARGYLRRPGLTADRFQPDPFALSGGGRLYRTGDLARYRPDGTIQYLGRLDFQVKLRGLRIELGEIEAALTERPEISRAAVTLYQGQFLAAYLVLTEGASLDRDVLSEQLRKRLPDYMVPVDYTVLDRFPQTASGKLDRKRLPDPVFGEKTTVYEAPQTPTEQGLAEIIAEVLDLEKVGRHDDFFALGGHSLLATRVVSRIRGRFGVELPLRVLFAKPTVKLLAVDIETELAGQTEPAPPAGIVADQHRPELLSFSQERLWFLDRLTARQGNADDPARFAYNMPGALHIRGRLDIRLLERTLSRVRERHASLRTRFPEHNGAPRQVIDPAEAFSQPVIDLSGLPEADREAVAASLTRVAAATPFDLARGPLLRVSLLQMTSHEWVLLLNMHHIISDGWSIGVLIREFASLYTAAVTRDPESPEAWDRQAQLQDLPVQYADYAAWQRNMLQGPAMATRLDHLRDQLHDAPALSSLPTDRPRPVMQSHAGDVLRFSLDAGLSEGVQTLARNNGVTLFMALDAAFVTMLARYSGRDDVLIGTPGANRNHAEVEGLIGFFVNTLVLRHDLSGDLNFRQLLERVRHTALDAFSHGDVPFERLVEAVNPERDLSHSPLFQIMFILQNTPEGRLNLPGVTVDRRDPDRNVAKFDLTLEITEGRQGLQGLFEYNTDLFDRQTIAAMAEHYVALLSSAVVHPDRDIRDLDMMSVDERIRLLRDFNRTDRILDGAEKFLHTHFLDRFRETPDAPAVRMAGGETLTYAQLDRRTATLAAHLQGLGVGPETVVGLCALRSLEMIIGMLGVLRAGGAYLPLDPDNPSERLSFMVRDADVAVLLAHEPTRTVAEKLPLEPVYLEADLPDARPASVPLHPENAAYVIYTSGSTGLPKGVPNTHQGITNRLLWLQEAIPLDASDILLQKTPYSFDVSVWEFFQAHVKGGLLVMARPGEHKDPAMLARTIQDEGITTIHFVPSMLAVFMDAEPRVLDSVRRVICSGEALSAPLVRNFHRQRAETGARVALFNLYGPTESAVEVTWWRCPDDWQDGDIPIGRPIANMRTYILDPRGHTAPMGVPGELYLAGVGLARGYRNRPALTADRFQPDPFAQTGGERLYRTGDLARFRPDGTIQYMGRLDFQVKLRGLRIELGEIEAALEDGPEISRAAVTLYREQFLTAYLTLSGDVEPDENALRERLRKRLPEYMVPAAFIVLPEFPRTASGKLDRKRLPDPVIGERTIEYVAPQTFTERVLARIIAEVLGLEKVGRYDNFFALGGHSLLATRVISRINDRFNCDLPIRAFFEDSQPAALAKRIEGQTDTRTQDATPPAPDDRPPILSYTQQRMWFVDRLVQDRAMYNMPATFRVTGLLDMAALERAATKLADRHAVLRTRFRNHDGQGVPVIEETPLTLFKLIDLTDVQAHDIMNLVEREAAREFDLTTGPLLRVIYFGTHADRGVLQITMHHIISDGWSIGIFIRELTAIYSELTGMAKAADLPPLPVQYTDYAAWQRDYLSDGLLEKQIAFWQERLAGMPALLELPTDRPRPAVQTYAGGRLSFRWDAELTDRLSQSAGSGGASLFMLVQSGLAALLSRYTGMTDIALGTPTAGRNRAELEGLIGAFINTLVLRNDLSGDPGFNQLVERVRNADLDAFANQDVPFELLVDRLQPERNLGHTPFFQVMLSLENFQTEVPELSGVSMTPTETTGGAALFDLTIMLRHREDGLSGSIIYNKDLFNPETVQRLVDHWQVLLKAALADPEAPISRLPLMEAEERTAVLELGTPSAGVYPEDKTIHQLFRERAAEMPDRPAVVVPDGQPLTYAELDVAANRLAHLLVSRGVVPDQLTAVAVPRSPRMITTLLGILKAGGAYLPIDHTYPAERIAFILQDAAPKVLVTVSEILAELPEELVRDLNVIVLDRIDLSDFSEEPPEVTVDADHTAYVNYTSGSTGHPKGVTTVHRGVTRLVFGQDYVTLNADSAILQAAPIPFDGATFEIWGALLHGGRTVLHPEKIPSVEGLRTSFTSGGVNTVFMTTALFNQVMDEDPSVFQGIDELMVGGEAASANHFMRALETLPDLRLSNIYGPTESTTYATCYRLPGPEIPRPVPIGPVINNTTAYVLDSRLQPQPIGVPGVLFLGGAGLARGYLNRPGLTADRFVPHPFGNGEHLYDTGDLVRFLPDGSLQFLGRVDHQVKLRGHRIELGEIEAVLREAETISGAVVLVRDLAQVGKALTAYVTLSEEAPEDLSADLKDFLGKRLPAYMTPSFFLPVDRFPLTPNGKLDIAALPEPGRESDARDYVAPAGPMEEALASIWRQVLGVENVSAVDNFFDLGGHSLLATRVVSRIREQLALDVPLQTLFNHPELSQLAARLEDLQPIEETGAPRPVPLTDRENLPLSFAQQRLWFLDRLEGANPSYNIPHALRFRGPLDVAAVARTFQLLGERHESLRTSFTQSRGKSVQKIAAHADLDPSVIDLTGKEEVVRDLIERESLHLFDLETGPLLRVTIFRLGADDHILALNMHHIISDGWSMDVLMRDFRAGYAACLTRTEARLPQLPIQYADFAAWQRQWLTGEVLSERTDYWTKQLADLSVLNMPSARPRPAVHDVRGAQCSAFIDTRLTSSLKELARRRNSSVYMTLLTTFYALLHRYTGQTDLAVGTPVANRGRLELEHLIGFFLNTLVLRGDLSGDPSFSKMLDRVRAMALKAFEYQDMPFEKLVEELQPERDLSRNPLFQVYFNMPTLEEEITVLGDLDVQTVPLDNYSSKFDLGLYAVDRGDTIHLQLIYATALFDAPDMENLLRRFINLLSDATARPEALLSTLSVLDSDARRALNTAVSSISPALTYDPFHLAPDQGSVPARFREIAARYGDSPAVADQQRRWTYSRLEEEVNRVAHAVAQGKGNERIALLFPQNASAVAAMLGVLSAGSIYVPLDPYYPQDRIAYILEDAEVSLILTDRQHLARARDLAGGNLPVAVIEDLPDAPAASEIHIEPAQTAYLLYTSGSTGVPKGVVQTHRGMSCHARNYINNLKLGPHDQVSLLPTYSFDAAVMDIYGALLSGACLHVYDLKTEGFDGLAAWLDERQISVLHGTPTVYRHLIANLPEGHVFHKNRLVVLGGEEAVRADFESWRRHFPDDGLLVNGLGPTESTVALQQFFDKSTTFEGSSLPIGFPAEGIEVLLLNEAGEEVADFAEGEIVLRGAHLASGYWRKPELTEAAFIPDGKLHRYHTGDRARRREDGSLVFAGRKDQQVKIRGHRIEPAEIEARLLRHEAVREAVVLPRPDRAGNLALVAYVVPTRGQQPAIADLYAFLKASLPAYMVPAAFVLLESLPQTAHGKLDRRALPEPDPSQTPAANDWVAPRNEMETLVADIWSQILELERVGATSNFFELGGHSLMATKVVSRLRETTGLTLSLRDFFETPTVEGLAEKLRSAGDKLETDSSASAPVPSPDQFVAEGDTPLSFAQQRLWFLEQLEGAAAAYYISVPLSLRGPLDVDAVAGGFRTIVARHNALRTGFSEVDGKPVQEVHADIPVSLPVIDIADLADQTDVVEQLIKAGGNPGFDLARPPLIRCLLIRLAAHDHVLLVTMHHIISDAWSMDLFNREFDECYRARLDRRPVNLSPLPRQYTDFSAWQRAWLRGPVLEKHLAYWKRQLAGAPEVLEIPGDYTRPALQTYNGNVARFPIPSDLSARVGVWSQDRSITPFMFFEAAFAALLYRTTGQDDVLVGMPISGRNHAEIENLIGFFVNTLVLRNDVSGDPAFSELASRVQTTALDAFNHQDLPFELLVQSLDVPRDLGRPPLFQVMFNYRALTRRMSLPGLSVQGLPNMRPTAQFDLTLTVEEAEENFYGSFEYNTDLYAPETIERLTRHYLRLVEGVLEQPELPLSGIQLTGREEQERLSRWNEIASPLTGPLFAHRLIAEAAIKYADQPALTLARESGDEPRLSYAELTTGVNKLAHRLLAMGVRPDQPVALLLGRSLNMYTAMAAVMTAGGAYVPLDPAYPAERLNFLLRDCGASLLITESGRTLSVPDDVNVLVLDDENLADEPDTLPGISLHPHNTAYIIYTSGSTGIPKGVAVTHQNLASFVLDVVQQLELCAQDRVLQFPSYSFDASIENWLVPLTVGAHVVARGDDMWTPDALHEILRRHRVTAMDIPPILWSQWLQQLEEAREKLDLPDLRLHILGGETLPTPALARWNALDTDRVTLINSYGPTETTIALTYYPVPRDFKGPRVPIGPPRPNRAVFVLDREGGRTPVGLPGQLFVGGDGISRGYIGKPGLTASAFVPDPFSLIPGARMYATGDLGRYLPDGTLDFMGRIDRQVKLRGFRIELGEV
ncbi:MAG: non-ribosomal peptide synthase/polyketide synthase, partial [Acidobacteriota bacterium]|nr:non-ribosomal peptide synthase/polyketide synthase [Acidobacteriota bacterium]